MVKTGNDESLGTAEGALLGRASHVLHAESPILDDQWAILLLHPDVQALKRRRLARANQTPATSKGARTDSSQAFPHDSS